MDIGRTTNLLDDDQQGDKLKCKVLISGAAQVPLPAVQIAWWRIKGV
jgi:hypothetical protein